MVSYEFWEVVMVSHRRTLVSQLLHQMEQGRATRLRTMSSKKLNLLSNLLLVSSAEASCGKIMTYESDSLLFRTNTFRCRASSKDSLVFVSIIHLDLCATVKMHDTFLTRLPDVEGGVWPL